MALEGTQKDQVFVVEDLANSNDDKKKQCAMTDNDLCHVCNLRLCFMHSKIVGEVCKIVEEVCKFEDFSRWLIIIKCSYNPI